MKKKNIKPLIMSSLAALSLGSISVAGTFALFTDSAETTVNIGAGKVKVGSSLSGVTLYSADASYTTGDVAGVITGDFAGTYYYKQQDGNFANGGTASVSGSTLSIERMSPGDKVVTSLGFVNDSNVNIKYRLKVTTAHEHGDELLKNLELKVFGNKYHGLKSLQTKWTEIDAGAAISGSGIEVVLPLETGNEAQAKDAEIKFTLEAVQANAEVTDADKAEYYADAVSTTEYLAPEEITSEKKTAVDKVIEVPLSAEASEEKTVKVSVPAGAQLEDDASSLKLYVENMGEDPTYQGIAITVEQGAEIYEVTLDGLKDDNDKPITVTVDLGYEPVAVYHVHGEQSSEIDFDYDEDTGLTTFTTTNFSEFTFVRDTDVIEIPNLAKLEIVRNHVNSGHSLAGKTVKLLTDLDMNNQEWTPIGTSDHPFSGVFDGDGHTIRNLKITEYSASNGVGLIGNLVGDESKPNVYSNISQVWSNNEFNEEFFAAEKYSARVSNLNIVNFQITSTTDYTGSAVGYAKNAYVSNVSVSNGTMLAKGKMGGVVGATGRNMVLKGLTTAADVTLTSTKHSVGGIVGGFNRNDGSAHAAAAINCVNNASIVNNSDGVVGGIVGNLGSTTGLNGFIYNCVNNGNISLNNNGGNKRVGGLLGDGTNAKLVANSTNNGNINLVSSASLWYVGGISSYSAAGGTIFYNCVNNGDITAYAERLAGIVALENDGSEIAANCANNGILTTTNPNGAVYQLTGGHYSKQTYTASSTPIADIAGVNDKIDDNYSIYEFNGYGEIDGEMVINNYYVSISADSRICSTVNIANSTTQTVTLDIPGISCTISSNMSNLTLVMKGAGSHVTVANGAKVGKLQIEGANSTATINGDVEKLILAGASNPSAEIATTGKCQFVSFSGTGNFTLTNRGLISSTCENQWGTSHVVTAMTACTVTINNYGVIESKTGETYGKCAYALLFYNGCDLIFNAYNGSRLSCEKAGLLMAYGSANSITFNYQAGAELMDGGNARLYPSLASAKVTVNALD